jgi:hypothetical protein
MVIILLCQDDDASLSLGLYYTVLCPDAEASSVVMICQSCDDKSENMRDEYVSIGDDMSKYGDDTSQ